MGCAKPASPAVACSLERDLEKYFVHQISEKLNKMAKLFVYGVNARCPRDVLENEFSRCGEVTDVYITEKGYAFVTMAEDGAADEACKTLNGSVIDGQEIKVDRARGGDRRGGGGGGGFRGGRGGGFGGGRGGGGGGGGRGCYNCHQEGHIARECPEQRQDRY